MTKIQLNFDGASQGNPGPAGAGGVIKQGRKVIKKYHRYLGKKTNNQAEYLAALLGIKVIKKLGLEPKELIIVGDSKLIIEQIAGNYKVKNPGLKILNKKVQTELKSFTTTINYQHVKREQNKTADKLATHAINNHK